MKILVYCSNKQCLRKSEIPKNQNSFTCPGCGQVRQIDTSLIKDIIERCCVCGLSYLYVERNFNGIIGGLVIVSAIVLYLVTSNLFILLGVAALDFILYFLTKPRTICYKCLTEYVSFKQNPEHKSYSLGTASRFADKE